MNAIGAIILLMAVVVILGGSRRWAILAMMAGVLFVPQTQQVSVGGLNLFASRFLELAGFIRVMARREFSFKQLNGIDKALILFYVYSVTVFVMRETDGQAYMIGTGVDMFLCYFAFRGMLQDLNDYEQFLRSFIFVLAPYVALLLVETTTYHNPFTIMGGMDYGWFRSGRLRCMGSFRNPSLLGTLGATFLPMYMGLACIPRERKKAVIGMVLCAIIVLASNSGGPLNAAAIALIGWLMWRLRERMQLVRRLLVALVVAAALLMKAPVWYLIARVSDVTGGDGFHRSYLMDISFKHLGQWWLNGMSMSLAEDWFPDGVLSSTGNADITNQFLAYGLNSGLGALVLFIVVLARSYGLLGKAAAVVRSRVGNSDGAEYLLWGLGVMLTAHIFNWLGITYFDQTYAVWFMQLAAISSMSAYFVSPAQVDSPGVVIETNELQPTPHGEQVMQ